MNILVCVKQVPGSNQVEVDPVTGILKRDGVEGKVNPYDLYALELALSLCERYGGEVKTISMGPPKAKDVILETIYMGAVGGCLVSDRRFAGADVLATSYTLSQAIRCMGVFDLIVCGKQTTDGDTAQVGAELAEFLQIPHASNVMKVLDIDKDSITVKVNMEHHIVTERIRLPCLICADSDINTPRLPSYKRKRMLADFAVKTVTIDGFEDKDDKHYGISGSPTQVERIFQPDKNLSKQLICGSGQELADKLFDILSEKKFI